VRILSSWFDFILGCLLYGYYTVYYFMSPPNSGSGLMTDANLNRTTLTYETCNTISNALLTKVVPPISTLDIQYSWDSNCQGAKMMSATDPNGFSVGSTYNDPFWRPTSKTDQLNNTLNFSYYPTVPINTSESQMTFGSSDLDAFSTNDALGRPLYSQQIEGPSGSWDTVQMGYSWNTTGRVTTKTMPCATTKGAGCSNGTTTVTHDALGQDLVTTDGGGGTLTATYTGHSSGCGNSMLGCVDVLVVLGPAPAGGEVVKQVQKEYDGLGQVRSVCQLSSATGTTSCGQANGGTGYLTTYNYNADGTVSSIVRGAQTHSFTYDALGRTLTTTYPESGTKQFFYDTAPSTPGVACSTLALLTNSSPLGHLLKTYDANGTSTCFSYDTMSRNTSIAYAGTNWDGENKYFVYDSSTVNGVTMTNTLGRVAEAYTAPTSGGTKVTDEGFSYTARGEISDVYESTPNSGGYYHTTASYFANGALSTLGGITGGPWTYAVDGKGRPYSAVTGSTNLVSSTTYNAADEPLVITLGLGDRDTYVYDNGAPLTTGRMTSYTFAVGATPTTDVGSLTWNANGTPRSLSITDGFNAGGTQTCNYGTLSTPGYDELGRLVSAVCNNSSGTNVWGQSFAYDAFGNLTKSVPSGDTGIAWQPGYNQANNRYTLTGTSYDSNGNLLTDTFHTYTWNQDNHPLTVTNGTSGPVIYDAFGRMVEHLLGTTYKEPLISPIGNIGLMNKTNVSQFRVPLPGGVTYTSGSNFWHKDWLGSVRLISVRGTRAWAGDVAFAPYGEIYNSFGSTNYVTFTGDNRDLVAGTFDTPNRELNPTQGRWISPDPAHASWNAYAYTTNPLGERDLSGLQARTAMSACGATGCWYGSFGLDDVKGNVDANGNKVVCVSLGGCPFLLGAPSSPATTNASDATNQQQSLPCSGAGVPCTATPAGGPLSSSMQNEDGSVSESNLWFYQISDVNGDAVVMPMVITENVVDAISGLTPSNLDPNANQPAPSEDGSFTDNIGFDSSKVGFPIYANSWTSQTFSVQFAGSAYDLATTVWQFVNVTNGTLNYGFPVVVVP
jgi:RHS repeat-associated protein